MSTSSRNGDAQRSEEATYDAAIASQRVTSAAKQKKAPSPRGCRNFIRKQTANAMPDIVNTFVEMAKEGSVPHFTSLTKVGGFDQKPVPSEAPRRRRKTLARQLMDEVEKYEAKQAAELAAANDASLQTNHGGPQERL